MRPEVFFLLYQQTVMGGFDVPRGPGDRVELQWRKSRRSANNGACVEVAPINGRISCPGFYESGRWSIAVPWRCRGRTSLGQLKAEQYFECDH